MIVMRVIVVVFEIGLVVAKTHFACEPCFGQQSQRSIDRRVTDRWISFLDEPVKVLDRQMFFRTEKDLHYQLTLICPAQS